MFYHHHEDGFRLLIPGIRFKTHVHGEKTLLAEFHLDKGSLLPRHAHPHEQTGFLVSGHMRFLIGDEAVEVRPGDSWCIPGNVEHAAEILADSVAVEIFSPVREDYLPAA